MDATITILLMLLYRNFLRTVLPEKIFRTECNSLGRCICQRYRIHGHVADGKKESGELVLVDSYQRCFNTFIFCKGVCFYKCVLFDFISDGFLGVGRMDET